MAEPTLHRRLSFAFGVFGLVLALIFGVLIWGTAHFAEDRIVQRLVTLELQDYLERRAQQPDLRPPNNLYLRSVLDPEKLPQPLKPFEGRADGLYKLEPFLEGGTDYHLVIRTLDSGERLFLYIDASMVEVLDDSRDLMIWSALLGTLFVSAIGVALGRATARQVIAPVVKLAARVRRQTPNAPANLSRDLPDDEVGLLARTLETSMARSHAFLERERRFTRDASHELRSPITVVRGAVELLEALPTAQYEAIQRPVERIRRANDEMARLVEAFLWLAREEALAEGLRPQSLREETRHAIRRYQHLLVDKDVDVTVRIDSEAKVDAPAGVLGIVIGNLVSNAFHFVRQGRVSVHGNSEHLRVIDSGPGMSDERLREVFEAHRRGDGSQGFGLGLAIVHDLCERFGWWLEIDSREGEGTEVRLSFCPGAGRAADGGETRSESPKRRAESGSIPQA